MNDIIDRMVMSVQGLKRVESSLFYDVEGVPVKAINSVVIQESCVEAAKQKVASVIDANCHGPSRLVVDEITDKCEFFFKFNPLARIEPCTYGHSPTSTKDAFAQWDLQNNILPQL